MNFTKSCPICGGNQFYYNEVLWLDLIADWELKPYEVDYINRQQGIRCAGCENNLRSMALASAILFAHKFDGILAQFICSVHAESINVLEINEAGGLSSMLARLPNHTLAKYPEHDMMNLSLDSGIFDLVLHSDTLEHIPDPVSGLSECCRILKPSGRCIYTVPMLVDRLSRSRKGLKYSYHGNANERSTDYIVHTEFGADAWIYPIKAGFHAVRIHSFEYPCALAIEATL